MKQIYLDNSATTKVDVKVVDSMLPYFTEVFGNSNSLHSFGLTANKGVNIAKKQIADALNVEEREIFFTSGGTEANNWVIKGIASGNKHKGKHIIVSAIEHHSIIDSVEMLSNDYEIDYLPVDSNGIVDLNELKKMVRSDTILVSVMAVNNETGAIQPIKEIANIVKEKNPNCYVHTDCVQALSVMKLDVKDLGVDMLTISSHKIHPCKVL